MTENACKSYVHFDGWGRFAVPSLGSVTLGRMKACMVLDETEQRFRVRFLEDWPRGREGDVALVPKWAMQKT